MSNTDGTKILNVRAPIILKEAIRLIAKDASIEKTVSSSDIMLDIFYKDTRVIEKLELLKTMQTLNKR